MRMIKKGKRKRGDGERIKEMSKVLERGKKND